MVEIKHSYLSVKQQCQLLSLSRSSFYYKSKEESSFNLELMRIIDEVFLKHPCFGVGQMTKYLRNHGYIVNFKRLRRLMRLMNLIPIYPKPKTSIPNKRHKKYPYLLRALNINKPNQVWATDITYIPMKKGFFYLAVIMDWHTRKVLSWRISNTLDTEFCVEALEEAVEKYGIPEIMNSDQGSQFTSLAWISVLEKHKVQISMDGKGRFLDNIFVERLWRSLKYECVYIYAWEGGLEARKGIAEWIQFYNTERPHSAHGGKTPFMVYYENEEIDQKKKIVA